MEERLQRAQVALQSFVYIPTLKEDASPVYPHDQHASSYEASQAAAAYRSWDRQDLYARLRTFKVSDQPFKHAFYLIYDSTS